MPIRRLIYTSHVARHVRYADAEEVARASVERNQRVGVTGLLLYTPSHFLQVLEGEPKAVEMVYQRIAKDPRHSHLRVLDDRQVDSREFGAWAMRAAFSAATSAELEALDAERSLSLLNAARSGA